MPMMLMVLNEMMRPILLMKTVRLIVVKKVWLGTKMHQLKEERVKFQRSLSQLLKGAVLWREIPMQVLMRYSLHSKL